MKLIATIQINGISPVPWKAPNMGRGRTKAGKAYSFATYKGKEDLSIGKTNFLGWQKQVKEAAKEAMGGRFPSLAPIEIQIDFLFRAPEGTPLGSFCFLPLKFSKKTQQFEPSSLRGSRLPDVTNMFKSTEDALQGVVFTNDNQVVATSSKRIWWSHGGCRITVYSLDEEPTNESDAATSTHDVRDLRSQSGSTAWTDHARPYQGSTSGQRGTNDQQHREQLVEEPDAAREVGLRPRRRNYRGHH